ncbi:MAG TPA: hypothetical protein VN822_06050 [Candidatus Acidoferrales bacterium]|nr:hypothetical protein [Candidatus Acidoferrales bacterium]
MNFQPKTEQEIQDAKLWKKGDYDFAIEDGSDEVSSKGRPMISLKLRLSDGNGKSRVLTDYLLAETEEKLRHAASACGLLDRYESGSIKGPEFRGKRGRLKLIVEKAKGEYGPKNAVADYICAETIKNGSGSASGDFGLKF